jgi:DNA-directed RNA polymerase specialized sigma24 family protein
MELALFLFMNQNLQNTLFIEKSTIKLLLTGSRKNDRGYQKKLFFLLHEFALSTCCRYTSFEDDPGTRVYESFIKLFQNIRKPDYASIDTESELKKKFNQILIDTCIETGSKEEIESPCSNSLKNQASQWLSTEEVIGSLRKLSFSHRMVFNLSVIDRYSNEYISEKLKIPTDCVTENLKRSRERLRSLMSAYVFEQHSNAERLTSQV